MAPDLQCMPAAGWGNAAVRNRWTSFGVCVLLAALGCAAAAKEEKKPLNGIVSPRTAVAPCDVVVQAVVEPDAENRLLRVEVDSPGFYSSSTIELEGDRAPRARQIVFRTLPAGSYRVTVKLVGVHGERGSFVRDIDLQ